MSEQQQQKEPTQVDLSFLRGVVASPTAYSEGWRELAARTLWLEAEIARLREDRAALDRIQRENADAVAVWAPRALDAESKLSALIASVREIAEKSKAEANAATETAKEAESKRMYVTAADQLARAVVHQEIAEALLSALQQAIGDK